MRWLRAIGKIPGAIATWLGERFELEDSVMAVLRHPVPRELERPVGWWYVLGSATLAIFVMQVVTGVGLAMTYVPAPNSAYDSLQFISHDATLGAVVRGMHYFGAGAMVILVLAHMTQVYLFGAFKFPREANWLTGSLLLLATLAMAFTGQLLRWDQDAFWAVVVAAEQAARAPIIGEWLTRLIVAGNNVGGATLTRFYATHVFLIPAAIFGLIGMHLYLVVKRGISEPPVAGRPVDPPSYRARYAEMLRRGIPFWPDSAWRDAVAAAAALPFIAYAALTVAGIESPWVPKLEGGTLPGSVTQGLTEPARRGSDLFVSKACVACHAIEGAGGRRGPDLSHVGSRLNRDQLTARIATGGGGMPAFAGSLTPNELDDLVTFLTTRR